MTVCHVCGIPWDAGFFDESSVLEAPDQGQERVLARYELHRNYCGLLLSFAQFTTPYAADPTQVETPGYRWQIRCNGRPRDPYLTFAHIINPWGSMPFPLNLRLEEGCLLEFVVRNVSDPAKSLCKVGGRIVGRYWYNSAMAIEGIASMKSFKPRQSRGGDDGGDDRRDGGRNAAADFKGAKRSNATHASTTDPDAMLYRKGPGMEARLRFIGHGLMENRSRLIVGTRLTRVSGHAERLAALDLIAPHGDRPRALTLGADKGYDAKDFVMELRALNVCPHVAQNSSGYAMSQRLRERIEEAFGWIKTVAGLKKTRFRGPARVDLAFTFAAAACNLVRLRTLLAGASP